MALSTLDIIDLIEPFKTSSIFKGVFPCDELPKYFTLPATFVINLSKHNSRGTHWVGLYISSEKIAEYFDSFGLPPTQVDIIKFIERNSRHFFYNKKQIQHLASIKCGKYVILFILCKIFDKNFNEIIDRFSNNLQVNEIIIENIFKYFNDKKKEIILKKMLV